MALFAMMAFLLSGAASTAALQPPRSRVGMSRVVRPVTFHAPPALLSKGVRGARLFKMDAPADDPSDWWDEGELGRVLQEMSQRKADAVRRWLCDEEIRTEESFGKFLAAQEDPVAFMMQRIPCNPRLTVAQATLIKEAVNPRVGQAGGPMEGPSPAPYPLGERFIAASQELDLKGNDTDVGVHELLLEGQRVSLLGDLMRFGKGLLFVRAASVQIFKCILSTYDAPRPDDRRERFVVTGRPGTGKSSFGCYFAAVLLARGFTVYYQFKQTYGLVLEPSSGAAPARATIYREDILSSFRAMVSGLPAERSWYLIDSAKPIECTMPALLVTSPKLALYQEWLKQGQHEPMHMPEPTFEEIKELSGALESGLQDDQLEERIFVWGYALRYVASGTLSVKALRRKINKAINLATFDQIKEAVFRGQADDALSSQLIGIRVPQDENAQWDFYDFEYHFASAYVEEQLFTLALRDPDKGAMWRLVNSDAWWTEGSQVRAVQFERLAIEYLCQKGTLLRIRLVNTRNVIDVVMPGLVEERFTEMGEVQSNDPSRLWVPTSATFPAVDAIYFGVNAITSFLFQMTVQQSNDPRRWDEGKREVVWKHFAGMWAAGFGSKEPVRACVLVPTCRFLTNDIDVATPAPEASGVQHGPVEVYMGEIIAPWQTHTEDNKM